MKKFARHRSLDELRPLLTERRIEIDTTRYDAGSDWVALSGSFAGVEIDLIYCPFNGHFYGEHEGPFSERCAAMDAEPWYAELLDLLYVPREEAAHA